MGWPKQPEMLEETELRIYLHNLLTQGYSGESEQCVSYQATLHQYEILIT